MSNADDEFAAEYLAECRKDVATMKAGFIALEKGGSEIDEELVNRIFLAVHSVRGVSFFGLTKIRDLAQLMEETLARIRAGNIVATPDLARVLLRATDRLRELIQNSDTSNRADISEITASLAIWRVDPSPSAGKCWASTTASAIDQDNQTGRQLKMLLVEDDFASRLLLQNFLSRYGECHVGVNGREAVDAFRSALERAQRYDLVCMDIMMPEMDGREAVRQMRALEEAHGIFSTYGAKIIMTTAVNDIKEVIRCFKELCDAYLLKPIDLAQLLSQMKAYHLVQ